MAASIHNFIEIIHHVTSLLFLCRMNAFYVVTDHETLSNILCHVLSVSYCIISASLAIKAEQSAYLIVHVVSPICLSAHVNCGKTADWIRMPFGVVSGVQLDMGVLDFGGDRQRGRGSLGR